MQTGSVSFSASWSRKHKKASLTKTIYPNVPSRVTFMAMVLGYHCQYSCSSRMPISLPTRFREAKPWNHVVNAQKEIRGHLSPVLNCNKRYKNSLFLCVQSVTTLYVLSYTSFVKYTTPSTWVVSKLHTDTQNSSVHSCKYRYRSSDDKTSHKYNGTFSVSGAFLFS